MASPIRTMWRVKAGTVGNFGDLSSVLPPACEDATPATATGVAFPANRNEWRERKSKGKALVAYKSLGRAAVPSTNSPYWPRQVRWDGTAHCHQHNRGVRQGAHRTLRLTRRTCTALSNRVDDAVNDRDLSAVHAWHNYMGKLAIASWPLCFWILALVK